MERSPALTRKFAELTRRGRRGRDQSRAGPTPGEIAAKLGHLRETEIFAPLSDAEQAWLMESTTMITCEAGRVFHTPTEPGEVVFLLKRGKVDIYRLAEDGRKLVVATLGPHAIFGEMGLIGQGMYGCYAEALTDCLLCVLSRSDLQQLIRRNPEVAIRFLDDMGRRLQEREAALEELAFRALPSRLAALLLREADESGVVAGLTHEELAERLGTYRETVSQILGRFRKERLVSVEPRRIAILDAAGLRDRAQA